MKLADATALRVGSAAVTKVYAGAVQVWPAVSVTPYSLFPNPPVYPDQATDGQAYVFATEFWVTKAGCYATKVRYFQPTVGTLAIRTMALYSTTNGTANVKVGGNWTMPTPVAGQWCEYTLPTAIPLAENMHYRVACLHPASAGFARNYFWFATGSGEEGASSTTLGGYLVRPSQANAYGAAQGSFAASATMTFPSSSYQNSAYFSDITVVDVNPSPGPSIQTLFSGVPTFADQAVDAANGNSMATEFYVTIPAWVTKVRYLHPTVGTLTPRTMALYSTANGTTGTKVGGDWTMPTPTAGQWCTYTLPAPVALTAGTRYRITTLHPAGSGFARTMSYFTGAGAGASTSVIGGYLGRPGAADALAGLQGSYSPGASMAFPSQAFSNATYYSDVEVTDVAP